MPKDKGELLFHNSVEKPFVPDEPKKKKNRRLVQINPQIQADYIEIARNKGKQPKNSGFPEVDQIDIDRHTKDAEKNN